MYYIVRGIYTSEREVSLFKEFRIKSIASYDEKSQNCFEFPQVGWLEVIYNYNASKLRIA